MTSFEGHVKAEARRTMITRKPVVMMAAVVAAASFIIPVLGGTAQASDSFQISSDSNPYYCMQESGTTSGLYLDPCGSNSSNYWEYYSGDANELENAHSHLCITYEGLNTSVDLHSCDADSLAQDWLEFPANGVDGPPDEICLAAAEVDGESYCLWQSNKSVMTRDSVDSSNVHDLWNF
jgi:hypothetical protein